MKTILFSLAAAAAAVTLAAAAQAEPNSRARADQHREETVATTVAQRLFPPRTPIALVRAARAAVWRCQRQAGIARTEPELVGADLAHAGTLFRRWIVGRWHARLGGCQDALDRRQAALPAHNALWECLMPHEGGYPSNQDTGRNGHYGGLQMHPGWGYGTSYHASDDPWAVQKQAAENGYAASGYSSSWLWGQWGQTLGYCSELA